METLINKYLHGQLNDQERQLFEEKLASDLEFAEEVKIRTIVFADYKSKIKKELLQLDVKKVSSSPTKQWRIPSFVKYAASVALIAISFLSIYNITGYGEGDEQEYYSAPVQYRSEINENSEIWNSFIKNYNQRDFKAAIDNANQCIEENGYLPDYGFYLGLAYFYSKPSELEKAIKEFDRFEDKESKFYEERLWFSGLSYIELGEIEKGKNRLRIIVTDKIWNYKEAELILLDLK